MRLYMLYALLVSAVVVASLAVTTGLPERMRRWLIVAVALLVMLPATLFLLFNPS